MPNLIKKIKNLLTQTHQILNKPTFRIEEINFEKQTVILYYPGIYTALKLSIREAITDNNIISKLLPAQACWLGYYYGKHYNNHVSKFQNKNNFYQILTHDSCRYRIISLDKKSDLLYIDTKNNKTYQNSPLTLSQNISLIENFHPSQACYIGILAGLDSNKSKPERPVKKNNLYLVL